VLRIWHNLSIKFCSTERKRQITSLLLLLYLQPTMRLEKDERLLMIEYDGRRGDCLTTWALGVGIDRVEAEL